MDITKQTTDFAVPEDRSWLGSAHGTQSTESGTLDVSTFTEADHYPDGWIKSGICLQKSGNLWVPYAGAAEVQTLTFDATGGVYTLAFDGSAASASQTYLNTTGDTAVILAALESLSTINPGDVTVSRGTPAGNVTIFTVTFAGSYAGENVPLIAITETLTGGSTTLVPLQVTAGDGGDEEVAHLYSTVKVQPADVTVNVGCALFTHGKVREANLPENHGLDDGFKAAVAGSIRYI